MPLDIENLVLEKTPIDLAKAQRYASKWSPTILRRVFQALEITKHLPTDYDVRKSKRYKKVVTTTKIRKYDGKVDGKNTKITLSDRELTVAVGQTEMVIDPENMRDTWASDSANITEGKVALEVYFLEDFLKSIGQEINNNLAYWGDSSSTDETINLIDGIHVVLEELISDGELTPVITPAHTQSTGTFGNIAQGTIFPNVEKVWKAFSVAQRASTIYSYVSFDSFEKYAKSYRAEFGHECTYNKSDLEKTEIVVDGSGGKHILCRASWMGTSNRIISVIPGALRLGTDVQEFASSLKIQEVGYQWIYLIKVVLGVDVVDTEAIKINNLH